MLTRGRHAFIWRQSEMHDATLNFNRFVETEHHRILLVVMSSTLFFGQWIHEQLLLFIFTRLLIFLLLSCKLSCSDRSLRDFCFFCFPVFTTGKKKRGCKPMRVRFVRLPRTVESHMSLPHLRESVKNILVFYTCMYIFYIEGGSTWAKNNRKKHVDVAPIKEKWMRDRGQVKLGDVFSLFSWNV